MKLFAAIALTLLAGAALFAQGYSMGNRDLKLRQHVLDIQKANASSVEFLASEIHRCSKGLDLASEQLESCLSQPHNGDYLIRPVYSDSDCCSAFWRPPCAALVICSGGYSDFISRDYRR